VSLRTLESMARRTGHVSDTNQPAVVAWQDERRRHVHLIRHMRSTFWTCHVESERGHPRNLWQSFNEICDRSHAPPTDIDDVTLHRFFDEKVDSVCFARLH